MGFVMPSTVERFMTEFQNKRPASKESSSAMPAIVRANEMFRAVCGQRGWNDTRESWIARGAARCRLTVRRARAIVYQEPIRLSADEYVAIQTAFDEFNLKLQRTDAALAAVSSLAGNAPAEASRPDVGCGRVHDGARTRVEAGSRPADREEHPGAKYFAG